MGVGGGAEYELIAGERRWRAAALAGQDAIPAIVKDLSDELSAEWALIENLQREDLGPMERADAFRALALRFNLTHEQIAARVGLDRSSVTNLVRLTELEREIRELLESGALGLGHGKALLSVPAGRGRIALAQRAAKENWSVRRLEAAARTPSAPVGSVSASGGGDRPASVTDLERQLGEHLGTKVKIRGGKNWKNGRLTIAFYDLDHFDGLMQKMGFVMRE